MQLPTRVRRAIAEMLDLVFDIYATRSYSQEGEDMILRRIFEGQRYGFYVDVGAHHPHRFSNTNLFYKKGWRGINIEPCPDALRAFKSRRPRDINLQIGISDCTETLTYYCLDEPALNTFDADLLRRRLEGSPYKLVKTISVPVKRLSDVLREHVPTTQAIDFLSVDVEGLDLHVLRSNDWEVFRPECVLVESLNSSLEDSFHRPVFHFMKDQGYELLGKTFNTMIFRRKVRSHAEATADLVGTSV